MDDLVAIAVTKLFQVGRHLKAGIFHGVLLFGQTALGVGPKSNV